MSDTWQAAPGARHDLGAPGRVLRVAIVGTGSWWGRQHARVFAERTDTELVAVVGRTEAGARDRAEAVRGRPYADIDTMLAKEHPAAAGRRALELARASIRSFETGSRIATPRGSAEVPA